eukprot:6304416-Amphidinium_carterae.1
MASQVGFHCKDPIEVSEGFPNRFSPEAIPYVICGSQNEIRIEIRDVSFLYEIVPVHVCMT